jgi:5-(carboxyamino)imidazole ribonucleotide mutase
MMGGLDSLLSIVQMPAGIPVATVGVNAGENAGLLALQILGIKYPEIATGLQEYKENMKAKINADDEALQALL